MKEQNSTPDEATSLEKWDRARTLMLESLYKPDDRLRGCAYSQGCKDAVSYTHLTLPTIYSV